MRLLDYLTGLVSLLALPFIAWWGVNQSPQSAAALEARLQSKAAQALQLAGIDWAIVSMDGQTAILTGAAPSEDAVDEAAALVLRSSGPGGVFLGGVSQVETRVTAAAPVRPYVWSAEKRAAGRLVLSGHVPSRAARAALLQEARALAKGPVVDEMALAAGAPGGNWQAMARFAIGQALELDTGSAALTDTTLTVRGEVADDDLRARLARSTRAVAAPFRGVALIRGAALWSATRTGNSLVLSGRVASEADRRALATLARRSFGGDVIDEMTVEPMPEPDWVGGAVAGLAQFAAFGSGRMTYDAATGGFMFEGEAPASTLEFLNEDMTRAKGDWHFVIGVASPAAPEVTAASAGVPAPCAGELDAALESAVAGFAPGRAAFRRDSAPALDALALTAQRCDAAMEIEVTVGSDALDEARAAVIADFLERVGVQRPRVAAIGYGPAASVESMDTERGRVSDPQIEFTVRERSGQ
ncbi:MAG: hypothetical protein FP825_00210 [Hyphomonas sp.]|uniref:hypothetical protein n=1 Tax=Hyphomonas sp. TaxID=87 RepID=UPI0017A6A18D|nr:hypothetical protein [Hyphomonas sp.]MBU3921627.1 hypothetical protein [Alphaproteobacteria bacterium]MBA3066894.1 hypothetical protein [Hyphomonas sp.]MBU4060974.1 hypothetical protein [Alphaproteobacteria bacterium]MBU4166182.1 hypothetical protein [Alphaproteobacteria bacterium]MBU4568326.1 hypothetical protein [Alphaproteobacteria bacterium]